MMNLIMRHIKKYVSLFTLLVGLWCCCSFSAGAQEIRKVEGIVTDAETGETLIGVAVILKNTTSGVITNYEGHYSFGGLVSESVLQFSYVGYETKEVRVGTRAIIDIQLESVSHDLDAVVVFGENQKDVRMITGSVGKIDTKVFSAGTPAGSFDQLLQGQVAGLAIQSSGEPGEKATIRIRGNNSLGIRAKDDAELVSANRANEPLYILNGSPITSDVFSTINPDDIVDIRVLKDGLSTVEYGTRGANGVIEIKTKRGIVGKTVYNVRYQHTVKPISDLGGISLMKSSEKLALERELEIVSGLGYIYSPAPGDSEEEIFIKNKRYQELESNNTNWLKELSRIAQVKDLQLSISGGADDTRYYLSTSYYDEQGGYDASWAKRFTTRFNLDHNLNENVSIGFDSSVGRSKRSKSTTSPASLIYTLQPYETTATTDFIARNPISISGQYFEDPFEELNGRYSELTSWRVDLNTNLNWAVWDGLNLNAKVGITYNDGENNTVTLANRLVEEAGKIKGAGAFGKNESKSFISRVNLSFDYNKHIGDHSFSLSGGSEYIHTNSWGFGFNSIGISDKVDPEIGVNPDATVSTSKFYDALLGFYARGNYNFNSKYNLTGSFRYDGSSILPEDKQFVPAWGVGAAWNVQKETWFAPLHIFDQFKLRASYGVNYNSGGIRQTLGLPFYDFTNSDTYRGERVINLVEFWNSDLKFERAKQWSLALDFGLLNHRIYGTIEGYIKNTDDLLATVDIPSSNGYSSLLRNIGKLRNRGIELQLSAVTIRTDDFRWTTSVNFAYNDNEITDLYLQDEIKVGTEGYFKVGEAINSAYVKHWAGVNPVNGVPIYYDENKRLVSSGVAPQMTGFGTYTHPVNGGLTNIFNYGDLEISTLFTYAWGGVNYNNLKARMISNVKNGEIPYDGFMDDIWLNPGDEKPLPYPKFFSDTSVNSLFVENASYVRWKNIIVRYNLGDHLNIKGVSAFNITAQANNLLTITAYEGIDPEISGIGQPLPKSFTLGLDVTF
ncbi:SusC/RagA family TonB-linked outer membrane protein [Saccharicrinis fermentans]|uniref:Outer membrane cobalamin receptor protein n=1 Tax=Saccharicrinis fermentans DSM 9555 = JCM 21142 TaxID=869213 RepID=W7Y7K2_9BACT|nr:SusC/RagA family TonB-linked outer membrane protein [Saccharicrinis fermentans]GAF03628.1 outer membrane cobalamin receptor protein [Saccharicrinis fermentans DSM 9555 = JCM 21142]